MSLIDPLDQDLLALRTLQCPQHVQPNIDGTAYRVSSGAFQPGKDGTISVDLEESLRRAGLALDALYPSLNRAVALTSNTVRQYETQGYAVRHDPIAENEHHGAAATKRRNNALRQAARAMAECASFVVPIDEKAAVAYGAPALRKRSLSNE